jgi:hypothetical protein
VNEAGQRVFEYDGIYPGDGRPGYA